MLKDLTIILPIGIETEDRLRNFLFTSSYLFNICPETKFIFHEMGDKNHIQNVNNPNLLCLYTKTPKIDKIFHKTWCINRALEYVDTKVVCIYDVDVLIPLESIKDACNNILNNNFDMVLPYSYGLFQKMILEYEECEKFKINFDFNEFKTIQLNSSFYGHVQFFNTQSYCELGGENEDIVGWGPEDQEKLYKMLYFGYKVKYLENSYVWHIEHQRIDPRVHETENYHKNMSILDNIRNMSEADKKVYYQMQKNKLKSKFISIGE